MVLLATLYLCRSASDQRCQRVPRWDACSRASARTCWKSACPNVRSHCLRKGHPSLGPVKLCADMLLLLARLCVNLERGVRSTGSGTGRTGTCTDGTRPLGPWILQKAKQYCLKALLDARKPRLGLLRRCLGGRSFAFWGPGLQWLCGSSRHTLSSQSQSGSSMMLKV